MARPVTLFTGQWADLPLEALAKQASHWGFDGLELACWGDHFEVDRALESDGYVREKRALLDGLGLSCLAISNHLVGQCTCDPIDARHKDILPDRIWGDGDPEDRAGLRDPDRPPNPGSHPATPQLRLQFRSEPPHTPAHQPRLFPRGLQGPHLPRPHQGRPGSSGRPQQHPLLPSRFRGPSPRLGLRLPGQGRSPVGPGHEGTQSHRIPGAAFHRVGRLRHGP